MTVLRYTERDVEYAVGPANDPEISRLQTPTMDQCGKPVYGGWALVSCISNVVTLVRRLAKQ